MKTLKWILFAIAFTGLMVAGFAFDVPGAQNIVTVLIWLNLVMAAFCLSDAATKVFRAKGRTVPESLHWLLFLLRFLFLAWFGEFVLCTVYFAGYLLTAVARYKAFYHTEEVA